MIVKDSEVLRHSQNVRKIATAASDLILNMAIQLEPHEWKRFQVIGRATLLVYQKYFTMSICVAEKSLANPAPQTESAASQPQEKGGGE